MLCPRVAVGVSGVTPRVVEDTKLMGMNSLATESTCCLAAIGGEIAPQNLGKRMSKLSPIGIYKNLTPVAT